MFKAVVFAAFIVVFAGMSLGSSWENGVGVYFDQVASCNCAPDSLGVLVHTYLLLENPTTAYGVAAWQGTLRADSGVYLFNVVLSGNTVNVGTPPEYIVGIGLPLPSADVVVLASFDTFAQNAGGIYFDPLGDDPSPLYVAGDSLQTIIAMNRVYGSQSSPDATIGQPYCPEENGLPSNEWPVVDAPDFPGGFGAGGLIGDGENATRSEQRTWGSLKALFE